MLKIKSYINNRDGNTKRTESDNATLQDGYLFKSTGRLSDTVLGKNKGLTKIISTN